VDTQLIALSSVDTVASFSTSALMKSRSMRFTGNVARIREKINVCRFSVGNPEGKILLERPRRR
jgi:hypothetical protein